MRSLHDYSFKPKSLSPEGEWQPTDIISLVAECGLLQHVCEILELPTIGSTRYPTSLSDICSVISTKEAILASLSWVKAKPGNLHPSNYRRQLSECLEWKASRENNEPIQAIVDCNMPIETYMLASCQPSPMDDRLAEKLSLIQILLEAGANPMVQVEPSVPVFICKQYMYGYKALECAWRSWLFFLSRYRLSLNYDRTSTVSLFRDVRVTLDDMFNTTKAMLAHGASVFMPTTEAAVILAYPDWDASEFPLAFVCRAMFWLQECFSRYSEFRDFAAVISPPGTTRPWRKIDCIYRSGSVQSNLDGIHPNDEELEMLWPLLEKWENTGDRGDRDALQAAMRRVWKAHDPHVRFREYEKAKSPVSSSLQIQKKISWEYLIQRSWQK